MNSFNNSNLGILRADIVAALKQVEAKHNIKMSLGAISYEDFKCSVKLTNEINSQVAQQALTPRFPHDYKVGEQISYNGKNFKLVNYKRSSGKYPVIAIDLATNKQYKLPLNSLVPKS